LGKRAGIDHYLSQEGEDDEQDQSLYSRFYISGRDIAAFFMDCGSESADCSLVASPGHCHSSSARTDCVENFCSLVDRCRMAVIVDQVLLYMLNCLYLGSAGSSRTEYSNFGKCLS